MNNDEKPKKVKAGEILFALLILLVGTFALYTGTSLLAAFLSLFRLWPLLIIGIGVWLVFKNIERERIAVVILAALLIGAVYVTFSQLEPPLESLGEEAVPPGVTKAAVSADFVSGKFSIGSTPEKLYISKGYNYPLEVRVSTAGQTVNLHLSLEEEFHNFFRYSGNEFQILLNENLPLSIDANTGAAHCIFDLSHLKVEKLSLDGGLTSFEVTFGEMNTKVSLDMGLSSGTFYVPQSVGVRIISEGLVSLSVPSDWIKTENGYKSLNYDTALYKIDITCHIGLGYLKIAYQ